MDVPGLLAQRHPARRDPRQPGSGGKVVELETLLYDSCIMAGSSDVYAEDGSVLSELPLSQLPGPAEGSSSGWSSG
jgi:hypothetical protein